MNSAYEETALIDFDNTVEETKADQGQTDFPLTVEKTTITETTEYAKMKRLQHSGFDPSCDCWCCNSDLRRWCIIIGFLRLIFLVGLEACLYISFFPIKKHEDNSNKRSKTNRMMYNKTVVSKNGTEPKMISVLGNALHPYVPAAKAEDIPKIPENVVSDHLVTFEIQHFYFHMVGLAVFSILVSAALLIGAKSKKSWLLAFVPLFGAGKIAGMVWLILLEDEPYFNGLYLLSIWFDAYVIVCSLALICHFKKGYYNTSESVTAPDYEASTILPTKQNNYGDALALATVFHSTNHEGDADDEYNNYVNGHGITE